MMIIQLLRRHIVSVPLHTTIDTRWPHANKTPLCCYHALVVAILFADDYTTLGRTGVAQMRDVERRALCGTFKQVQNSELGVLQSSN